MKCQARTTAPMCSQPTPRQTMAPTQDLRGNQHAAAELRAQPKPQTPKTALQLAAEDCEGAGGTFEMDGVGQGGCFPAESASHTLFRDRRQSCETAGGKLDMNTDTCALPPATRCVQDHSPKELAPAACRAVGGTPAGGTLADPVCQVPNPVHIPSLAELAAQPSGPSIRSRRSSDRRPPPTHSGLQGCVSAAAGSKIELCAGIDEDLSPYVSTGLGASTSPGLGVSGGVVTTRTKQDFYGDSVVVGGGVNVGPLHAGGGVVMNTDGQVTGGYGEVGATAEAPVSAHATRTKTVSLMP
jgi:hypothetical protein